MSVDERGRWIELTIRDNFCFRISTESCERLFVLGTGEGESSGREGNESTCEGADRVG